jgi:hypothetical protein
MIGKNKYIIFIFLIFVSILVFQNIYAEKITVNNGLGYDGASYAMYAKNFDELILSRKIDLYRIQRIIPSAIIHYSFKIFRVEFGSRNIIVGFQILNSILLVFCFVIWHKIMQLSKITIKYQILGLVFLFGNFAILKFNFYQPILTDISAFTLGICLLYSYLVKKNLITLLIAVIGFFTWPAIFYNAIILYIFSFSKKINENQRNNKINLSIVVMSGILLTGIYALCLHDLSLKTVIFNGGSQIIKREYLVLSVGGVVIFISYLIHSLILNVNFVKTGLSLNKFNLIKKIFFSFLIYIFLSIIQKNISGADTSLSPKDFFERTILLSVTMPVIFFVSHVVYFGPSMIIFFVHFKNIARIIRRFGLGMVILFLTNIFFLLFSESRIFINLFPIIIYFLILYINQAKLLLFDELGFFAMIALSFIFSKFWLHIGLNQNRYFMNIGPWMNEREYLIQGLLVLLLFIIFIYLKYRSNIKIEKH